MAFSGAALAYCAVGGLVAYSGIKGATLADTAKAVLSGNLNLNDTQTVNFSTSPSSNSGSGSTAGSDIAAGASSISASSNQTLAKQIATSMGLSSWTTGQEWSDWVSLWNQESGWSTTAANPTSNARGIAQNINGWSSSYQENNPTQQITWGINYIQSRYGSPSMAWGHEQQYGWY